MLLIRPTPTYQSSNLSSFLPSSGGDVPESGSSLTLRTETTFIPAREGRQSSRTKKSSKGGVRHPPQQDSRTPILQSVLLLFKQNQYMANAIADKLRIKPNFTLLTLNAPADFKKGLGKLPAGVTITDSGSTYNQVHWFVLNRAQLEKEMSRVMKLVKPEVTVWVYYPKGTSKIQTDLTRDKG